MPKDFRRLPKTFEEDPKCFDDTQTNLSTIQETNLMSVKSISSHVRISYRFYQFVTTQYTTDFYIIDASSFESLDPD